MTIQCFIHLDVVITTLTHRSLTRQSKVGWKVYSWINSIVMSIIPSGLWVGGSQGFFFTTDMTVSMNHSCIRNDLIVTNGASQGLYMLSSLLFSRGDVVFVEDPTYFLALKLFQDDMGFRCVPGI